MGGEGSMMAANNSLKNNRNLVSKRKEKRSLSGSYTDVKLAKFPEATPELLLEIKLQLKKEKRSLHLKQAILFLIIVIVLIAILTI
ncbi:hypothetical protein GCM10011531_08340 [Aquaticitalea lipolytica]|jgi:hypothetical protein|uniref:Uncharacterized protein n=1 Tax=Aquaticitalea lipolytica TaxID=1247562 RepID=A0A8J2TQ99_9FLAO|nr:hypothetical protein [Aquaticitalea lipolytica]GFZ80573.1 hypothetical protein GCM10011531_08340 [Aquaticitalea lipolytica]|tara:strand:+ start:178 stop:435 length:258 start_codon:yes stop_codon:yes gene_type:complete